MEQHRTALAIAAAALILGIAAAALLRYVPWGLNVLIWSTLLRYVPWGLNVLIWTALLIGCGLWVAGSGWRLHPFAAIASLLLAACVVWRDSRVLVALDVALLLAFVPMLALGARGVRVAAAGLSEVALAILTTAMQTVIGFPQLLARDLSWSRIPIRGFRGVGVVARGTFIATPVLVLFGSLLTSADANFEKVLRNLFAFDLGEVTRHILVTLVVAVICAGFLRSLALSGPMSRSDDDDPLFTIPAAETNVALTLVNLLFAVFVAVQFRYFFGSSGLSASAYARRGFFELVWVVALVLPMLLVLEYLIAKKKLFRILAGIQVALVFVIAASAWQRMQLYRDAYGLTRLRVFTTAFMIWIAVLLLWFVLTVLTGRRQRFAIGALATAVATVIALHAINPDAMIVETNLARARDGRRALDVNYALSLSDDAVPVILANADAFGHNVLQYMLTRERTNGWRTWNLSRARAIEAVRRYESKATPPMGRP